MVLISLLPLIYLLYINARGHPVSLVPLTAYDSLAGLRFTLHLRQYSRFLFQITLVERGGIEPLLPVIIFLKINTFPFQITYNSRLDNILSISSSE